jgi:hypothetical protein
MSCRTDFNRFRSALSSTVLGMMLLCCAPPISASGDQPNVEPNDLRWDLAGNYEFRWTTVDLSTKVIRGDVSNSVERRLAISCELRILDTEELVAFEPELPWILSVSDRHGNDVRCQFEQWPAGRWYKIDAWPLNSGPQGPWVSRFTLTLRFSDNPNEPVPASLAELQGYVYVVLADDVLFLDIPFDPNSGWHETEAAPDLQICIDPPTPPCPEQPQYVPVELLPGGSKGLGYFPYRPTAPVPLYRYRTWIKSKSGAPVMALRDRAAYYHRDVYPLGDYAILRTELYDSVGQTSVNVPTQEIHSGVSDIRGTWCWGQMEQGRYDAYDTIRHVVAVHPVEVKIPFVLTDIPVPSCPPASD